MCRRGIVLPKRIRRRIEVQRKRQAVAKLARKPKEKTVAKRRQQLAEAQRRFRECNKKSSLEKFFNDSTSFAACARGYFGEVHSKYGKPVRWKF